MSAGGWRRISRFFRWWSPLAFLLPGLYQVARRRVRLGACVLCLLGMGALVNVFLGTLFTTARHLVSMDPLANLVLNWNFFASFPGDLAQENLAPDTITVIAEVTPTQITYERLAPIHSAASPLELQRNFWPMLAFWVAVYLACGFLSLRDFLKDRGRAP